MSYSSGGYKTPLIGVGAVIGLVAILFFGARGFDALDTLVKGAKTPEGAERALFANPETGPLYRTLKRTYPQDYAALIQDIVGRAQAGESNARIDQAILGDMMQSARRQHHDVIQAPADLFTAYRRAEIKVVETLRDTNMDLCATYVMTGEVRSPELRGVQASLIAYRIVTLEAGAAGRDHPANRAIAAPVATDVEQLGRQMTANGTPETTVKAFLNGGGLAQLSPREQCLAGVSFYRAVDQMPVDKATQIYAYLISRNG